MQEIAWKGPNFRQYKKTSRWYLTVSIFFLIFLIWSFWEKNFIFSAFLIITYSIVIHLAKTKPILIEFKIDGEGISIGNKKYFFPEFKSFYILEKNKREILILRKKTLGSQISLPLKRGIAENIKKILSQKIEEEEMEEPWIDIFLKKIGF